MYIIEHETRGILMELPYERDEKPHFSWSKNRPHARLLTLAQARQALDMRSMPEGCYILEYRTWDRVPH